jgi:type II secretory pathway pseudopilin PulG
MRAMKSRPGTSNRRGSSAYTVVEVVIAVLLLGILATAVFGGFSSGLMAVQAGRENARATQILMQKMETVRLFTWSQGANSVLAATNFTDYYDPTGTTTTEGTVYQGIYSASAAPTTLPADYRNNMRLVTVTLYWTNYLGGSKGIKVQSRQMQTYVARYGMQSYVYQ